MPHLLPNDRVLILGCGNSALAFDLCKDGVCNVTSLDISPVVIDHMRARAADLGWPHLAWTVGDMLSLPFPDGAFDVVIEKGELLVGGRLTPSRATRHRCAVIIASASLSGCTSR